MDSTFRQRALGEESFELRELNERLESYLQRVAFLEQENSCLRGEIQALKGTPACGKRGEFEQGLEALREALAERWRETDRAALERDGLREEIRLVKERCAGEAGRREEARRQLGESRRELEGEKRGTEGLGHQVVMLEDELRFLAQAHHEQRAGLREDSSRSRSRSAPSPAPFSAAPPSLCTQDVDLYSQKVGQLWQASLEVYQRELGTMERSLAEARERLEAVKEEKRQNRVQLQSAQQEVEVLRERKGLLEGRVSQQSQAQREDLEQFQATIGLLEQDKESLAAKMDQILDEQHQLMQMKLALSLEVTTYRALLDAEIGRIRPASVTPRLPASHRDVRLKPDRNELAFQGRRAIPVEKPLYTSKSRDGDGDIARLRAQLRSGTDSPAYGLRARSLARGNRPKEFQPPTIDTSSLESNFTARRVKSQDAMPALSSVKNSSRRMVLERAALPQRDSQRVDLEGQEVGKTGSVTVEDQLDGESEDSVTEEKNEMSNGEPRQEQGQLDGGVKEDVIGREEFEGNNDRVSDAILANGTSEERVDGEQPEVAEDTEDLIQEEMEVNEETWECLTEEPPQEFQMEFDFESEKLLSHREHPAENAVEIIVRENDLRLKKRRVNGDAKERGVENELSELTANPGAGKLTLNGTSSENVTGSDAPQIDRELENKWGQSDGETKESVRDNRPGMSEEENDFGSPRALSNGTTEEHMADDLKPQVPREDLGSGKGQVNGGPKEHAVGEKESEMLEEIIDSVSGGRTQENRQTEVQEPGAAEGSNNLEPGKEFWSDTDEEHSTEEMSQILERKEELETEDPLGRDTEEHAVGGGMAEITEENLTPEKLEASEPATDEESELAEVIFDLTSEQGLFADANREQVLEESGPERLGELTGKKIPASANLPSAGGPVTGGAEGEVTEVQKDEMVEQGQYSQEMKERVIEEELDVSEGALDPESEKAQSNDDTLKHALDEETPLSEGVGHLVSENGQVSGVSKEQGSDEDTPISEGVDHLVSENGQVSGDSKEQGSDEDTPISEGVDHLVSENGQVSGAIEEQGSDGETPISEGVDHLVSENGQVSGAIKEKGSDEDTPISEEVDHLVSENGQVSGAIEEHGSDEETPISEGIVHLVSENGQVSGAIEEQGSDEDTPISEEVDHLVSDNSQVSGAIEEQGSDEETPISEGIVHLVSDNSQVSGAIEDKGSDEETSENKSKAVSEKVLLVSTTAEEDKTSAILGKEDLGSEEGELNEEIKEHAAENEAPEISEMAEQEVPHTEEETVEGMEGLGSGMGMFGDTDPEHVTDQELPQTEEVERKITEDEVLGTEERQSNGEAKGHWMEEKQPEISEELADQTVEEGLPSDTQATEDTKFQIAEEKIDLGSEKDQANEEAKDHAAEKEDSEMPEEAKDISERELSSDRAKEHAMEEVAPTSEGMNDLVPVKEDLEPETNKDPSVGKVDAEEFMFSDGIRAQEQPQLEEEMFGTPEEEDNLEPEVGETEEHVTEKMQSEIAEEMTGQVPELEPSSDTSQELATEEMSQESEGEEDLVSKKGQRVEETQMRATEGEKCQSSELKVEVVSDTGLRSGTAKEDMVEDNLEATGRKQDLLTERGLFNDKTKEFVAEEDKKLETTEDKEDPELEKGQFNEDIKEHVAETENSEGLADPVSEKALLSEAAARPTTEEDKPQLTEGRKDLGSEEGQLSEATEEHSAEDKKPEIAERKVAATGDDEDYLEMKIASPGEEMDPVKDGFTFYMEETHGDVEKGEEPVLDELSEYEERQEAAEERATSPFVTGNKESQPQEEGPLTSSVVQSLNEDCLAEVLQAQSLLQSEELSNAPDGVDGTAEDQGYGLQSAQEVLLEAQNIGGQSLAECPADASQSHDPLSEAGTTSKGVSQGEDTVPWQDTFSESSVNAEDVTVEKQRPWTMKGGMAGDINDDKSDLATMLNFGGEQDGADLMEESDGTLTSNGERSSPRSMVIESEDDGSINVRETEDETLTKMVDKSQTPVTAEAFEDANIEPQCVKADRRSTPSDVDSSLTSDDGDSPNASQTLESSAYTVAGHGENFEPLLPENQPQENSNGAKTVEQEDPGAVEEVAESQEFLSTFKEEKSTFAIPKLAGDPDGSPEGEISVRKDRQTIKMDGVYDIESLMDESVATTFQEETTPEIVQSTSPEKVEDSQGELHGPREDTEENSLSVSQPGSLDRNNPELNSDPAIATAAMTRYNDEKTEGNVPGGLEKLFGEDGLHESSVSQDLPEELDDENGKIKLIEDTCDNEYETAAFYGTQHSPEDIEAEQRKRDASQRLSRELEQEVRCDSVDLPLSTMPPQGTDTEDDKSPRSIISWSPKDGPQEFNKLQGEYFGGSGKGEETAVETIAAAYQYWSSEDD